MKKFLPFVTLALSLCSLLPQPSQGAGNDNPTGVTGEYNGSITTAGSVDPYTGNAKRFIDDLMVPGSVGAYPLKWTRILNTRNGQASAPFGQGGTWRHCYQWGLWLKPYDPNHDYENQYEGPDGAVSYPDGRTVEFRVEPDGTYWQNSGSEPLDGIEHVGDGNYDLLLPDGGRVKFEYRAGSPSTYVATKIVDPYGQITVLSYDSAGRLSRVTEPAGRYLEITYTTYSYQLFWNNVTYTKYVDVISRVEAVVNGQVTETVNYGYTQEYVGVHHHYNLTQVNYDDGTHAAYTYFSADNHSMVSGTIHTCNDVRYAGPMSRIEYEYVTYADIGGPPDVGQVKREKNLTTGQTVSEVIYPPYNPGLNDPIYYARTERRPDGATRSFQYSVDGSAELKSYTDFQNHRTYLSRAPGSVSSNYRKVVTDARGNATSTEKMRSYGAVMAVIHPDGPSVSFTYSNQSYPNHVASKTDERGKITYFDRDGSNRIWQTRYPNEGVEQFTYNGFGQVLTHTLTSGGIERYEYNGRGLKTSYTDPLGNVTRYNYHWNDRLQNVVDPYGNATWYDYNQRGQITRVTHQDGSYIENGYNPDGTLAWMSNELRQATTYTYDEYKRVLTVTNPLGQTTSTTYAQDWVNPLIHTTGNPRAVTLPSGRTTHYAYDENWRRTSVRQAPNTAADASSYFWYDQVGNLVTTQDPRGHQTNFGYDTRNRKVSAMDALSQVTRWYYDAASNVESIQLPDGNWETKVYDNMNRVTSETDPVGRVTRFDYTASGKLWHVRDGNNQQTTFGYDALDRKSRMTYPNGDYQQWGYDANSNLTSRRTVNGTVQYFSYDNRNKPVWMWWSNGVDWTYFQHDAVGRVTWVQNQYAFVLRSYDPAGRLNQDHQYQPAIGWKEVHHGYGSDGERTRLYLPGTDYDRSYGYDEMGRLNAIRNTGDGATWFSYSYDAASNEILRQSVLNNVGQYYTRDPLGRMSRRTVYSAAAGNISVEHHSYDAMSRLTSTYREEDGLTDNFGYDASGQLSSANYRNSTRSVGYTWDNAGNRTQVNDNGWTYGYGINALNQYDWTGDGGGISNGDEHEVRSYQEITYGYYGDTRLASVSGPGGNYNLYYDGLGRTVQRNLNGGTTYYVYDGEKPIYEYKADGSTAGWNVYGKGIDEPLLRADYVAAPGGQGYFFQQNHEGSVTHLTGWGGEVIESYRYDAFGAPTTTYSTGNFNNRFKFTGREYVPQFGFYEYRNRAYHPGLGRFMSEDPIGFQMAGGKPSAEAAALFRGRAPETYASSEFNLFRYCHNDPVNNTDPFGLEFFPGQFQEVTAIPNEPGLVGLTTPKLELSIQMVQAPSGGFSLQSKVDVRITSKLVATTANGRPRDRAAIEQTKVHENKHEDVARKWHDANQNKVPKGPFKTADEAVKAAKEAGDRIKADFNRTQEIDKQHKPDSVWKSILDKDR